jgi:hypothetical protein
MVINTLATNISGTGSIPDVGVSLINKIMSMLGASILLAIVVTKCGSIAKAIMGVS